MRLSRFVLLVYIIILIAFGRLAIEKVSDDKSFFSSQSIVPAGVPIITVSDLKQYNELETLDETKAPDKKKSTLSPYFQVQTEDASVDSFPLKDTDVDVTISGVIADVTVQQTYKNEGEKTLEAIYVFPMSTKAAVYGMTMTIGERKIVAEIQRKEEARANYEQAKSEGKTATLMEQKRPNVFQMNVANILPGDEIQVELKYTELLVPKEQIYEFVFPTVVGPRFSTIPDTPENKGEEWVETPYLEQGKESIAKVSINLGITSPFPIRMMNSPSHTIEAEYGSKKKASVDLKDVQQNKDFILHYKLAGEQVSTGLMVYEGEEENFFLAMVEPPANPSSQDLLPREYIYIVDVSGSMRGFPLSVSKAIIGTMLTTMRPTDYFNILFFAGGNKVLSEKSVPVTEENIAMAQKWLSEQQGGGGTQLLPAIKSSLEIPKTKGASRTFAIVTDGYVTVEKEVFELIKENLGEANFFTYGIGSSVNRHLIEGMARVGRGEAFVVTSQDDALVEGTRFANYILNPVLTDINVKFEGIDVHDVSPVNQPDLFAARPVVVYGKFTGEASGTITVSGTSAGDSYQQKLDFSEAQSGNEQSALALLWARNMIYELDDLNHLSSTEDRVEKVTQLGLDYNLMTQYTSFVAIDKVKRADGEYETVKQPSELPQGVEDSAILNSNTYNSPPMPKPRVRSSGVSKGSKSVGVVDKAPTEKKQSKAVVKLNQTVVEAGSLDEQILRQIGRKYRGQLLQCYKSILKTDSSVRGKIFMQIEIKNGRVVSLTVLKNTTNNTDLETCVRKRIKRWKYPSEYNDSVQDGIFTQGFLFTLKE
jgi:Ca-activated chloride channel homolog